MNIASYAKNLKKILKSTNAGKIDWIKQNSDSFCFYGHAGKNSLIKASIDNSGTSEQLFIHLRVQNSSDPGSFSISFDSDMNEVKEILEELYKNAKKFIEEKETALFDDFVNNL